MSKKEFLDKLVKKLSVLNEQEKQDIINEYTDAINEKVKHGQTEEEAVKDFGNINDLAKEILTAYKIDPDYEEESLSEKGNSVIQRWAEKIADTFTDLVSNFKSNTEINLQLVFEIIIKVFITLILIGITRVLFEVGREFGEEIFYGLFSPLGEILTAVWTVFLVLIFLGISVMIIISMFKQYFYKSDTTEKPKTEKPKKSQPAKKETTKKQAKESTKEAKKGTSVGDIVLLIVKIFVIIYVIIPMICVDGFNIMGFIVSFVYLLKGINLWGLCILFIGLIIFTTYLIVLIFNLLFGKRKPHLVPFIVSLFMIVIGTIMFIDMIMSVNYINDIPKDIERQTETKEFKTDKPVYLNLHVYPEEKITKTTNASMEDGKFVIKITHLDTVDNIEFDQRDNYSFSAQCEDDYYDDSYAEYSYEDPICKDTTIYNYISIDPYTEDEFGNFKSFYNRFIKDLKDNKFYNYNKIYDYNGVTKIEIEANEKTLNQIKFN